MSKDLEAVSTLMDLKVFSAAIQARGNVMSGFSAGTGLSDFDQVLKNLDTQGAIEENMLFLNRGLDLDFDDMLGTNFWWYCRWNCLRFI